MTLANFGLIGLGVMGRNLALNVADHGFRVAVWNRQPDVLAAFVREHAGKRFEAASDLKSFVAGLERPRRIMLMITAGPAVDAVLESLVPLLEPGDIVIDGGNTWYEDTRRREQTLAAQGLCFFGVGVSGGEEGARFGPSLMPGGDRAAYAAVAPIFEAIAAQTDSGACVTYIGADGAGHFVKMVHNGIEYADMQLIAEAYDVLRRAVGLDAERLAATFGEWNRGPLESFLIEITAKIFGVRDADGAPLVDAVLDRAGQKGTGRWTVQTALQLGVAVPSIAAALDARVLSSQKERRVEAERLIGTPPLEHGAVGPDSVAAVHDALYAAKVCAYAQGLDLIRTASGELGWDIDLAELARIWKGGCIIRARLLDTIRAAMQAEPGLPNLLLAPEFTKIVLANQGALRRTVGLAQARGIPVPALGASLAYFDGWRTANLPQNLTQAQRDAFGAHTYQRRDDPLGPAVHSDWL